WAEVVPHRAGTRIEDVDVFADHVVLSERGDALTRLRLLRLGASGDVIANDVLQVEEPVASTWLGDVREYAPRTLRYTTTSLVAPVTSYDLDLASRTSTLVKRQPVPNFDASRYATEREWATAPDGTRVPISIVWRRDRPAGPGPGLLYGYGSFRNSDAPPLSPAPGGRLDPRPA